MLIFADRRPSRTAFMAAIGTGMPITAYGTVDGAGMRLPASPAGCIGWLMLLERPLRADVRPGPAA